MNYFIYTPHHFTPHGRYELNKLTSLPISGFIAQLVEHSHRYRRGHGFNPVENLIFSGFFFPIGLMRDYVTFSKFTTKPRLRDIFSNFRCLRVVFMWAFFSSLLLWELFHDKIYIFYCGDFC